jgi:hypothetical protein
MNGGNRFVNICCLLDSLIRMLNVAAFAVSGYSSTVNRLSTFISFEYDLSLCDFFRPNPLFFRNLFTLKAKQFNALLGETYELVRDDKGFRSVLHFILICFFFPFFIIKIEQRTDFIFENKTTDC